MASPVANVGDTINGTPIATINRGIPLLTTTVKLYTALLPVVLGDALPAHAPFTGTHNTPVATSASTVKVQGIAVTRAVVDVASCGHFIVKATAATVLAGP